MVFYFNQRKKQHLQITGKLCAHIIYNEYYIYFYFLDYGKFFGFCCRKIQNVFLFINRESIGFASAYAYSLFTCVSTKLYILLVSLTIGLVCYIIIEVMEKRKEKNEKMSAVIKYNVN